MGTDGDLVDLRLERGCRAFIGQAGGQVVTFGWMSVGPEWIGELGLEIRPGLGEAYLWNCFTLPAHRHRGYFRALLEQVVALARDEKLTRIWIGAVDGGAESAVTGTGFDLVLDFRAVTLGGVRWITVRGAPGTEPGLVSTAVSALGGDAGPLRSGIRRARQRRH
jgi:GNAT superfamily N-acetyltransferase